jgi:alpha-beta hydrolase superfamily lysophospholipase
MASLYRTDAPGDWGVMQAPPGGEAGVARLTHAGRPDIFYRYWHVNAPATLLILHGLGAHSGWFVDMANAIAARGVNVYAMDHQGFGRSEGTRGHVVRWQTYLDDIDHMVDQIAQDRPGGKIFPLGHSMGGVFAIHYAAAHQDKLAGMILLNPWIGDTAKVPLRRVLAILVGGMRGSQEVVPLYDPQSATTLMTSNPEAVTFLMNDTYWVLGRTKSFYWQITQMRGRTLALAAKITLPTLVLQAERDRSVTPKDTRRAFDRIPSRDKTYLTYPEYEHDSEFQPDRTKMDDDIAAWVKQHTG